MGINDYNRLYFKDLPFLWREAPGFRFALFHQGLGCLQFGVNVSICLARVVVDKIEVFNLGPGR